jgi:hypothetical protein
LKQFALYDKSTVRALGAVLPSGLAVLEWASAIKSMSFYDNVDMVKEFICNEKKTLTFVEGENKLREYELHRVEDFSGVSGTGIVAKGIIFPSGKVIHEWTRYIKSLNVYPNIEAVEHIHGHEGRTLVKFVNE